MGRSINNNIFTLASFVRQLAINLAHAVLFDFYKFMYWKYISFKLAQVMFMHEACSGTLHFPSQIGSIYVVHYDDWWELDELTRSVVIQSHQHYLNLNLQHKHIALQPLCRVGIWKVSQKAGWAQMGGGHRLCCVTNCHTKQHSGQDHILCDIGLLYYHHHGLGWSGYGDSFCSWISSVNSNSCEIICLINGQLNRGLPQR
jgi:hypothetical protein